MKIWYQSLVDAGRMPSYFDGLGARARKVARPGVEVHFQGVPQGAYGGNTPADAVIYPYFMSLHVQHILDNALLAEAEGYDVFAVGSVQDPGLEEARSVLDIPVVGYGEAAMHFACLLGSRFVVLAFRDGFDQMLDLRIQRLGLASRALPTMLMDATFDQVGAAQTDPAQLVSRFQDVARRAIAQGAEAIIPGQLYLSEAVARAGVTRVDYLFRTDKRDRFVCEAKKPAEELSARYAFQAKRYAWNKGVPVAVLTDFEELKIYVVGGKPYLDEPQMGEWKSWSFQQYHRILHLQ